ncbi:MAG TPA: S8 family serine peptidase [Chitinophagaceae bacterium]|mgnify:CR=1 FL=1|nr:S8 family serine peptidase [Chitinophagaceae bacterium]
MRNLLFTFCTLFILHSSIRAQIKINYAYELPCYSYTIDTPLTKFITTPVFDQFITQVQTDIEYTLQHYTITDFTTLSNYYLTLSQIHILKGNYDKAIDYIEKAKQLQWKNSYKQCFGLLYLNIAKTLKGNKGNISADIFKKNISENLNSIQWQTAHDVLEGEHYQTLFLTGDRMDRRLNGFKYKMNYTQHITNEPAYRLIQNAVDKKYLIPIADIYRSSLNVYLTKYTPTSSSYSLGCNEAKFSSVIDINKLYPVIASYIDPGIDTTLFVNKLYTNVSDPIDGKDNDRNGFVDDYHGIAYDSIDVYSKTLLNTTSFDKPEDRAYIYKIRKGTWDLRTFQQTPEADYTIQHYVNNTNYKEYANISRKLGEFTNLAHGTSTADIILRNNPSAKLIINKIFFNDDDFHDFDRLNKYCRILNDMVNYSKRNGAKVINISWGFNFDYILATFNTNNTLDICSANEVAKEYFKIISNNFKNIIASAPDILFTICPHNQNTDVDFDIMTPANINLPNLITVGGIDCSNNITGAGSIGKSVDIYANPTDNALFPGGERQIWRGTSFSAPRVANLAIKLLAINPKLSVQELRSLIMQGANFDKEKKIYILNAEASMQLLHKQMSKK